MSFFNYLLISVLLLPFSGNRNPVDAGISPCESLAVEHTLLAGQNGKFTLKLVPKGGTAPYKIFIWSDKGDLLTDTGSEREYKNLEAGTFEGVVGDGNKCGKKFKIEIPNR